MSERNGQADPQDGLLRRLMSLTQFVFDPTINRDHYIGRKSQLTLDEECGYPTDTEMTPVWYKQKYMRWGIASRVVNIWPDECWSTFPTISDTENRGYTTFEESWAELQEKTLAFHYFHRVDRLSRIGRFGILFYGLSDGGRLERAPEGIDGSTGLPKGKTPKHQLNFVRAFDETFVRVVRKEERKTSPRYGMPTLYAIKFDTPTVEDSEPAGKETIVHWTRVQHVHDNGIASEMFGVPALYSVIEYIYDMRKVSGSSAEMFYKGGFPGYAFKTFPGVENATEDVEFGEEELRDQVERYMKRLQRYLLTRGGEWESLQPQVANPDKHLDWYIKQICLTIDTPMRIFLGSESGHLASDQDNQTYRTRLSGRQTRHCEPKIVRPFMTNMVNYGVLPKPKKLLVAWSDLMAMSEEKKADIALKKAQTLMQFMQGNVAQVFPIRLFLTQVMNCSEELAQAIEEELKKKPPMPPIDVQLAQIQAQSRLEVAGARGGSTGGLRRGNAPRKATGRPTGKVDKAGRSKTPRAGTASRTKRS